jgi:Ca-activated chloride channel family protein
MGFIWGEALVLLIVVPLLIAAYVWMQRRRRRYALQYASVSLVQQAVGRGPGIRRHIPAALYLLAVTAMVFALARPKATVPVPQNTGTVILSIDVSGSMLAEDVDPNRMEATKEAVRNFVEKQPSGVKIGIVSFSDFGALVAPPTTQRKPVMDAINRLRPLRGTNIGSGLQVALDAIYEGVDGQRPGAQTGPGPTPTPTTGDAPKPPPASIVLLSDGQSNTGPNPLRVADEAVAAGVKVYTVGIGTSQGTTLMIQGRAVFTRLDEETLRGVAEVTGGLYFSAADEDELKEVYDSLARERLVEDKETELTFAVTGIALLLSVLGGGLGLLWFNRLP